MQRIDPAQNECIVLGQLGHLHRSFIAMKMIDPPIDGLCFYLYFYPSFSVSPGNDRPQPAGNLSRLFDCLKANGPS
jgi:hypothetical protein